MTRITPRPAPDFAQVNLAVGGRIRTALAREHRVLTCMPSYRAVFVDLAAGGRIRTALTRQHRFLNRTPSYRAVFVIAHSDDGDRARQAADELNNRHNGVRSIYTVLLGDAQLTAMADGVDINVAVLVADNNHAPARTAIRAHNSRCIEVDTEHGRVVSEATLTGDLRAGDIYTYGTKRLSLGSADTRLAVYRARTDYDPATGEVQHHLVDPGYTPEPGERTGALTDGPDTIVFRAFDKTAFLTRLGLADLTTTAK